MSHNLNDAIESAKKTDPDFNGSLPSAAHAKKPYIDDGSPLPSVGQRVRCMRDKPDNIEGVVTAVDVPGRRIKIDGFISEHIRGSNARDNYWAYHEIKGSWVPWKHYEVTTENGTEAAKQRAGVA